MSTVMRATVGFPRRTDPVERLRRLSPREREILGHLAAGLSNDGVAAEASISPRTVESHVRSILLKLGLGDDPGMHARVVAASAYWRARAEAERADSVLSRASRPDGR